VFGQVESAGLGNSGAVHSWNRTRGNGHRFHSCQPDDHPCHESNAHCTRFAIMALSVLKVFVVDESLMLRGNPLQAVGAR